MVFHLNAMRYLRSFFKSTDAWPLPLTYETEPLGVGHGMGFWGATRAGRGEWQWGLRMYPTRVEEQEGEDWGRGS